MQLNTSDHHVVTGGLSEQKAFTVEMNSMLFRSVIDGIYANKITSPFREIATNARDAMVEAGRGDEQFDVALPSRFRPTFSIRDFGPGLSHEQVMGIYSTMFASTKRSSNAAVGMIGLGSKSPFAYTSAFTIASFLDGTKRLYSAFIGSDEVPQIALISEDATDEQNGIEISWAVKPGDIQTFRDAAPKVLFGFDPKPRILNETYEFKVPEPLFSGDGWWIYNSKEVPFVGPQARQGCVLYPLDLNAAEVFNHPLADWPIVIDFEIGQLNVATSREQLGYDDRTKRNVQTRVNEALESMAKIIQDEIDANETYLEACCWLQDAVNSQNPKQGLYNLLQNSMFFKRLQVKTRLQFDMMGGDHRAAVFNPLNTEMGVVRSSVGHRTAPGQYGLQAKTMRDQTTIYVELAGCKKAPSRMRRVLFENSNNYIIWVKVTNLAAWTEIHAQFGFKEWVDLSTVEPLAAPARGKNTQQSLRFMQPERNFTRRRKWSSANNGGGRDIPDPDEGDIFYVRQEGREFESELGSCSMGEQMIHDRIWTVIHEGLLPKGTKVYIVPVKKENLIELIGMVNFHDAVAEAVKERLEEADLTFFNGNPFARYAGEAQMLKGKVLPDDLTEWRDHILANTEEVEIKEVSSALKTLFQTYCRDELKDALATVETKRTNSAPITEKYPLLFWLHNNNYSSKFAENFKHYLELINACHPSTASRSLPLAA